MQPFTPVDLEDERVSAWTVSAWEQHLGHPVMSAETLRRDISQGTLPTAFATVANEAGPRPALDIGGHVVTHRQLDQRAASFATALRALGVRREQVVALGAAPSVDMVAAYLGLLRVGAVVLPLNPAATNEETSLLLTDSGADVVVVDDVNTYAGLTAADCVVGLEGEGETDAVLPDMARDAPGTSPVALDPDAPALAAYTSGTTGHPKSVPLTHRNLLSSIRGVMKAWRWNATDTLIHALPLHHQHGLGGVHATLLSGSCLVLRRRFDPADMLDSVERTHATVLFGVPAMHRQFVEHRPAQLAAARSLRLVTSGSAPLPPPLAHRLEALTGEVPVERYGSTEGGLNVSNLYTGPRVPGSIGLPLPGVEVAIVDDHGTTRPVGEPGELLIRGPQVLRGYGSDVADAASAFFGGWFRTGDVAIVEEQSTFLRIVGRSKDVIITGGVNVHPREVENALVDLPEVAAGAVVGIPSPVWGEAVAAAVVLQPPTAVDAHAILARLRQRLSGYKCPKTIVVVDALPHDSMGKIDRAAVQRLMSEFTNDDATTL